MKTKLIAVVFSLGLCCALSRAVPVASPLESGTVPGRFVMFSGTFEGKATVFRIDTVTGQTWRLETIGFSQKTATLGLKSATVWTEIMEFAGFIETDKKAQATVQQK